MVWDSVRPLNGLHIVVLGVGGVGSGFVDEAEQRGVAEVTVADPIRAKVEKVLSSPRRLGFEISAVDPDDPKQGTVSVSRELHEKIALADAVFNLTALGRPDISGPVSPLVERDLRYRDDAVVVDGNYWLQGDNFRAQASRVNPRVRTEDGAGMVVHSIADIIVMFLDKVVGVRDINKKRVLQLVRASAVHHRLLPAAGLEGDGVGVDGAMELIGREVRRGAVRSVEIYSHEEDTFFFRVATAKELQAAQPGILKGLRRLAEESTDHFVHWTFSNYRLRFFMEQDAYEAQASESGEIPFPEREIPGGKVLAELGPLDSPRFWAELEKNHEDERGGITAVGWHNFLSGGGSVSLKQVLWFHQRMFDNDDLFKGIQHVLNILEVVAMMQPGIYGPITAELVEYEPELGAETELMLVLNLSRRDSDAIESEVRKVRPRTAVSQRLDTLAGLARLMSSASGSYPQRRDRSSSFDEYARDILDLYPEFLRTMQATQIDLPLFYHLISGSRQPFLRLSERRNGEIQLARYLLLQLSASYRKGWILSDHRLVYRLNRTLGRSDASEARWALQHLQAHPESAFKILHRAREIAGLPQAGLEANVAREAVMVLDRNEFAWKAQVVPFHHAVSANRSHVVLVSVWAFEAAPKAPAIDLLTHDSVAVAAETLLRTGRVIRRRIIPQNPKLARAMLEREIRKLTHPVIALDSAFEESLADLLPPNHPVAFLIHPDNWNNRLEERQKLLAVLLSQPPGKLADLILDFSAGTILRVKIDGEEYFAVFA